MKYWISWITMETDIYAVSAINLSNFSSDDSSWKAHRNAKALKQEYNLIISFECILHIQLVRAIVYVLCCAVRGSIFRDGWWWSMNYNVCGVHCVQCSQHPLLLQLLWKLRSWFVVSITFIVWPQSHLSNYHPWTHEAKTCTNYNLIKSYVITMSGSYLQGIYCVYT